MDQKRLHILITGEEGQGRSFAVRKETLRRAATVAVAVAVFLIIGTVGGFVFFSKILLLSSKNSSLDAQLTETMTVLDEVQANTSSLITKYEERIAQLEEEKEELLKGSISRLDQKSKVIEKVMGQIGVEVEEEEIVVEDPDHSGGPFISINKGYGGLQILNKAERYLKTIRNLPLGRPAPGKISSKYGARIDPIKNEKAFHAGIDFRGNAGDPVKATADAVVSTSSRNSDMGNYIILSHNNGYETIYAHLQKRLVKKGEKVKRGQVIGQIGNTGRSQGSHLHYVIRYNDETIDPMKFLKVADLSFKISK